MNRDKLPVDVVEFLAKSTALIGQIHERRLFSEVWGYILDQLESPIEDRFFIACLVIAEAHYININPENQRGVGGAMERGFGIFITPQKQVGSYRVDFTIEQTTLNPIDHPGATPLVVELDGHAFHDKSKEQRAYEKQRDRFLVKEGYRVLHFTGSEVYADPYKVAFEVLQLVGLDACGVRHPYNPNDPAGLE